MPGEHRTGHAVGTTLGVLLAAVPLVLAGALGVGHATHVLDLAGGAAWLASPGRGLVSLVDGPSAQVAVTLRLPVADAAATVVQGRDDAYVVRAGTVARLDAATWTVGRAVAFAADGGPLTVLPGRAGTGTAGTLWVLDGRTVREVDARTLDVRATADLRLRGDVRAVVDDRGDLWAADDDRVARVRHAHGGLRVTTDGGGGDLVLVQGRPVLVDVADGTLRTLGGGTRTVCPEARTAAGARLVGSSTSSEVFAASRGTLRVAATDGGACGTVARVGGSDADLGPLAHVDRYVVAPDLSTGVTSVVDLRDGTRQTFALTEAGHRVELVARGATVFWNDLDGHGSGLLELADGAWRSTAVDKYDPATGAGTQVARADGASALPAAAAPAPFRVASLAPDRPVYAPGARALLTPEVTGAPAADELWVWRFENLVDGDVEQWEADRTGVPLEIAALPGAGEYAVTLLVTRGGATASASATIRVVEWCALVVSASQVDLAGDPTLEVGVDPACPVSQEITVTAEPWLEVTASGAFGPGSPGLLTLRRTAPPPAPGAVAGALRLEVTGRPESQVRVDVVGAAP